jgi:hypothetical protein
MAVVMSWVSCVFERWNVSGGGTDLTVRRQVETVGLEVDKILISKQYNPETTKKQVNSL